MHKDGLDDARGARRRARGAVRAEGRRLAGKVLREVGAVREADRHRETAGAVAWIPADVAVQLHLEGLHNAVPGERGCVVGGYGLAAAGHHKVVEPLVVGTDGHAEGRRRDAARGCNGEAAGQLPAKAAAGLPDLDDDAVLCHVKDPGNDLLSQAHALSRGEDLQAAVILTSRQCHPQGSSRVRQRVGGDLLSATFFVAAVFAGDKANRRIGSKTRQQEGCGKILFRTVQRRELLTGEFAPLEERDTPFQALKRGQTLALADVIRFRAGACW
mmetsp:Transcript_29382/g.70011  ORF Transcript_29382/g.70011 Transcript_29382/m.70011 type:complete len:272 (+) Transcript_29382:1496-2311(+)